MLSDLLPRDRMTETITMHLELLNCSSRSSPGTETEQLKPNVVYVFGRLESPVHTHDCILSDVIMEEGVSVRC